MAWLRPKRKYLVITVKSYVPPGFSDSGWSKEKIYCVDIDADPKKVAKFSHRGTEVTKLRFLNAEIRQATPHYLDKHVDAKGRWVD